MLKLRFLNTTKMYRLVSDTKLIDGEMMKFRIQVKKFGRWKDEIFKTEHPVCWVQSKKEGIEIVNMLKGTMKWQ